MSYPRKNKQRNKHSNANDKSVFYIINDSLIGRAVFARADAQSEMFLRAILYMQRYKNSRATIVKAQQELVKNERALKAYSNTSEEEDFIMNKLFKIPIQNMISNYEFSIEQNKKNLELLREFPEFGQGKKIDLNDLLENLKNPKSMENKFLKHVDTAGHNYHLASTKTLPNNIKYMVSEMYTDIDSLETYTNDKELSHGIAEILLENHSYHEYYSNNLNVKGMDTQGAGFTIDDSLDQEDLAMLKKLGNKDILRIHSKFNLDKYYLKKIKLIQQQGYNNELLKLTRNITDPKEFAELKLSTGEYAAAYMVKNAKKDCLYLSFKQELTFNDVKRAYKMYT